MVDHDMREALHADPPLASLIRSSPLGRLERVAQRSPELG
jgi:hypothetical protein